MEPTYGLLSLLPPLLAIILAILTRQVFVSLLAGIFAGWFILTDGSPWLGFLQTLQALVDVFQDAGSTRTIMFCALVGALILFIQRSGGVAGFILKVNAFLEKYEKHRSGSNRIIVQLLAWLTGVLIFVESSISVLTVGALYRPIFDKLGISREKLAYIADSSSAPASILIPFNGWGAFIMTLLAAEGFGNPFGTMMSAMVYNFYPMLALTIALIVILWQKDIGPMNKAEYRARILGQVLPDGAQPMVSDELTMIDAKENILPKARNMVVPIAIMVLMMPIMLIYTGWATALEQLPGDSIGKRIFVAIGNGSGSTSVLVAVVIALLSSMLFYRVQRIFKTKEMIDMTLKGITGLMPLALLMLMAFAIGAVCKQLGTGLYVANLSKEWVNPMMVPVTIFLVTCFIAFSTGTSWGTFAIMIPIGLPMAQQAGLSPEIAIAAVMGGGVFGDHCSPISDTTILSSMASASDHIDHVRTQLPYALIAGGGTALLYIFCGV